MLPVIETDRLVLRIPPVDAAADALRYALDNRDFHAPWSPPVPASHYTLESFSQELERGAQAFARDQSLRLKVYARQSGRIVGRVHFTEFVRGAFGACFLGYDLDEQAVGHGFMSEALRAAIPFVFDTLRLHRIQANYMPHNERSGRLLRRLGFTVEGYARDYLFIAGRWQDHILTSLVNDKA